MNPKPECGHALGLDVHLQRDEDGRQTVLICRACGELFDYKTLDGQHMAIARSVKVHADPSNYATVTVHRSTSAKKDDDGHSD